MHRSLQFIFQRHYEKGRRVSSQKQEKYDVV